MVVLDDETYASMIRTIEETKKLMANLSRFLLDNHSDMLSDEDVILANRLILEHEWQKSKED